MPAIDQDAGDRAEYQDRQGDEYSEQREQEWCLAFGKKADERDQRYIVKFIAELAYRLGKNKNGKIPDLEDVPEFNRLYL